MGAKARAAPAEKGRTSAVEKAHAAIHALKSSTGLIKVASASSTSIHPIMGINTWASASLKPALNKNFFQPLNSSLNAAIQPWPMKQPHAPIRRMASTFRRDML